MPDPIADMLKHVNHSLAQFGMDERVLLAQDVPVVLTLAGGRELHSTVRVHWTEKGPDIPDPEGQARRLAALVEGAAAVALSEQANRRPNAG